MCSFKITPELIIALFALVVAIMSYLHARSSSKDSHEQIEALKKGQKKFYDTYLNQLDEEKNDKKARAEDLSKALENGRKEMEKYFNSKKTGFNI